ncbi:MAG: hypothetical protein ABIR70_18205 [Bryobacteraceae bacterium]
MTTLRTSLALILAGLPIYGQVSPAINLLPTREFGQAKLTFGVQTAAPNLLEGKELNSPTAIAFDTTSTPPIVYVADTGNHRILAWRNPANLTKGNLADKVIGQRDFYSAFPGGPGSSNGLVSSGMVLPNSLAVDSTGNLYVLDAGNNRILRFPKPLEQQGEVVNPDLVIGQKTSGNGNQSNQGLPKPSDKTLSFNRGAVSRGTIVFDKQGNLWVADTLNNRVLRFPKNRLTGSEPAADLVLGQSTFDNDTGAGTNLQNDLVSLSRPTGLAIDDNGGVYVTDGYLRVVYYDAPSTGVLAKRVLGIDIPATQTVPRPPAPNEYTLGRLGNQGGNPQCVFTLGTVAFVCDNVANRIVRYGSPDSWPALANNQLSPPISAVYGQSTLLEGGVNRGLGLSISGNNTFSSPTSGAFFNNEMWIVDTGNNRVLAFASTGPFNYPTATRLLGQLDYDLNSTNLIDGRELFIAGSSYRGSALAVDRNSTPNRLYVADSLNNRILAFRDVRLVGTDSRTLLTKQADLIIGQPDQFHAGPNYPGYDPFVPSDQGLFTPSGVSVDAAGNLWVADTNNGRLVRFPSPFNQPAGAPQRANVVLGQSNFSIRITDASSSTMSAPVGVAVFNNGDVAAADFNHNRVLLFRKAGSDFTNGQTARAVLGQQTFSGVAASNSANGLNQPRGLAVDSGDRLYVADSANGRVIIYGNTPTTPNGATGTSVPGLNSPEGIAVSPNSGELWVAAYGASLIYRFPEFSTLVTNPVPTATIPSAAPIGIVLDNFDNIIAAEAANRLTFYYARAVYQNGATYGGSTNLGSTITPNLYTLLYRLGKDFDLTPADGSIPYPKTLGGLQVVVNGVPAPMIKVSKTRIDFLVPNNTPSSGDVEYVVLRPATGEIIAAGNFTMGPAAPGFFTTNLQGSGQIAACNAVDDCREKVNGPTNQVGQDQVLTMYLTGYGHLDNAPPDGVAPGAAFDIPRTNLAITINGTYKVPPEKILYSGLSPDFPGLWQINIRMPKNGEAGAPVPGPRIAILVQMNDVPSNIGGQGVSLVNGNWFVNPDRYLLLGGANSLITTIALK